MLLRLSPQKVWLPLSSGSCVHPGSLPWSGRRFPKGPLLDPARSSRPLANRPRDEEVRPLLREAQVPVQTGGGGGAGGKHTQGGRGGFRLPRERPFLGRVFFPGWSEMSLNLSNPQHEASGEKQEGK